jgi:hypothetical protein
MPITAEIEAAVVAMRSVRTKVQKSTRKFYKHMPVPQYTLPRMLGSRIFQRRARLNK